MHIFQALIPCLRPAPAHEGCTGQWDIHPALARDLDRQPDFDDWGRCVEPVMSEGTLCEFHWLDQK